MPATEAITTDATEVATYELAFHVLPTVAEGEVPAVVTALKDKITAHGGEIIAEEAPARFDLAYEIIKYLEGRNRRFKSAYFGWIRFTAAPEAVPELQAEIESVKELLRFLLVKLTKEEAAHPFYFHEALAAEQTTTITVDEATAAVPAAAEAASADAASNPAEDTAAAESPAPDAAAGDDTEAAAETGDEAAK